jgi:hypothetical protein
MFQLSRPKSGGPVCKLAVTDRLTGVGLRAGGLGELVVDIRGRRLGTPRSGCSAVVGEACSTESGWEGSDTRVIASEIQLGQVAVVSACPCRSGVLVRLVAVGEREALPVEACPGAESFAVKEGLVGHDRDARCSARRVVLSRGSRHPPSLGERWVPRHVGASADARFASGWVRRAGRLPGRPWLYASCPGCLSSRA